VGKVMISKKSDITLLDCTLRDGGYANNWMFGRDNIKEIVNLIGESNVEYIEIGFIRLDEYNSEQAQFNNMEQLSKLLYPTNKKLAVVVEIGYGYPVSLFPIKSEKTATLVRVILWKRLQKECFKYCQELVEKGYEVCVQLTRTDQYTEDEFEKLILMFNNLKLRGLYIVDTFGLFTKDMLLKYFYIADNALANDIALGYHSHNNMQQAFSNSLCVAEVSRKHELMVDASILGMGRGAGNLNIEIFMQYLNDKHNKHYNIEPILEAANDYIMPIYEKTPWGYSIAYYLSAIYNVNPSYVGYIKDKGITVQQTELLFKKINQYGANIVYDEDAVKKIIKNEIK
jgi:4-hydroxy 2-oxovalerate aldolase